MASRRTLSSIASIYSVPLNKLSFLDILLSHAQTRDKTCDSAPHPEGGFWTEGESPSRWAVRSRFDPRSADPPNATVGDEKLCQEARLAVAVEVEDVGSDATTRPLREKLIETARRREIDSVIVWRLDRWGRSLVATQASGTTASIASNFSDGS